MQRLCCLLSLIATLCALPSWLMAQDIAHIAAAAQQTSMQHTACPDDSASHQSKDKIHLDCCSSAMAALAIRIDEAIPAARTPLVANAAETQIEHIVTPPEPPPKA